MKTPLYFISDIHLKLRTSSEEKSRRESLFRLLDQIRKTGGTCFFVGDLFDFYFEYPHLIPKAYTDFYQKAAEMKKDGVELHMLLGNHDYWVQEFLTDELMDHVYFNDTTFEVNGKKFYISHGDGLLSWDHGYRLLKKVIRSPLFIWLFRWIHPTIAYKIANAISRSGRHDTHSENFNEDVRIEIQDVAKKHFDHGFDFMICGHYHLGEMFDVNGGKLAILGDWFNLPSYAVFDGINLKLHFWEHNA
ncbi:MAG: UDP-2,3-diacylglucosamine diphosphatase [Candidatus Marinimicrobia bacterium]|jgi:UDP-2,3-diacylglucosamine hydrolase|nr:UDP-2,3-diacylglucosamine diphosphatase [Candidatus Neomarinimicrobiota bacterium]MBT3840319.1 UDP-2,3-diacylglucosamine diphosphatase [Candidatus Neomarinimicrobiota bacterium]MBT4000097.1 UDP-2,3-diacylglucosamine diphosphatase [Candidatus Neomarinimicrobiota bacterium]MBT4281951.1 UDP-2,3-diacylglucosamine diphosphatase [Candidatus Neomarinimicrobiota bacterium]MBT4579719.1 UDP-2,3-diacylglucosamine diphosphatase [Candidatus Neomarinimicrobiota bacterium]